jgi:integrase
MKKTTGWLFTRNGNYYAGWKADGNVFRRALRNDQGQPITSKREAEEAKQILIHPFTLPNKVEVLQSLAGKLDGAKAELARWEKQQDEEQHPALPITQAWTEFLASPNRPDSGPETLYQYECQWSRFASWMKEKHPNKLTLRDVSKEIAEEYAGTMNHGTLSANTYNKHLGLLTLVFRVVKRKARITDNPWEEIQRKRLATHSRRELTLDELRKVCQSAEGELKLLLALGVYTGLRLGDCAGLRWAEVDMGQNVIRRIPNKTARRNPKPVIVPLHPVLHDMLAAIPAEQRGECVLQELAKLYAYRSDSVTDRVQAHFKACGLRLHKAGTGPKSEDGQRAVIEVGFHSLRHTFVSLCRESNAPLAVVESIVGHSSPAMTRHYTHVGELAAGRAVALLPSVMIGDKVKAVKDSPAATLKAIKAIAKTLTLANLDENKPVLLALLAS